MGSEQSEASHLFPYRFFGSNSYFGDLECITSAMRNATVRCELEGKVLILKKPDLFELIEEFPHFGEMWASSAWRRECLRKKSLKRLKAPLNYRHFAATTIQRFFRAKQAERRKAAQDQAAPHASRSKPGRRDGNHIWHASAPQEFSHQDLKNIASPAQIHTLLLKQVDKLQRSVDKMHEEVRDVRSDMKGVKEAFQGMLPAPKFQLLFNGPMRL